MSAYWKVLGLGLLGSLLATACVISTDDDGGFNFNDGDAAPHTDGGTKTDSGTPNGNVDAGVDAGSTPDTGTEMCTGPSGNTCSTCVTDHCLPEYCACQADGDCGGEGGEFACLNECMLMQSTQAATKAEAFQACGDLCAVNGGILAEATNTLVDCMLMGVADPLFADSGVDGGQIAVCGETCFGYSEPGSQ